MKPTARLFLGLASALVRGVDNAGDATGINPVPPIIQQRKRGFSPPDPRKGDVLPEHETKDWRGVSFLQHILDTYSGERHGRTYTKETMDLQDLQNQGKHDPGTPKDEKQTQARCPKCDALLMLGPIGARDNCPKCDTALVVKEYGQYDIKIQGMRNWKAFAYANKNSVPNLLCAGCEQPFNSLRPLVVGDALQPNDLTFCGTCGGVNLWDGSKMALLSQEDIQGLPQDVYKSLMFAREQVLAKIAENKRKQNKP